MSNVDRRQVLKQFAFVAAGFSIIPSCMQDRSKSALLLKKINITPSNETMLSELCETILPKTNTPGAKEIDAHLFVLKMVDDCRTKEEQTTFIKGMAEFKQFCKSSFGDEFVDCKDEIRKKIVEELLAKKEEKTDLMSFFSTVKSLVLQSYTSSKFYLTNIQVYELIPGRYHGCVSI